MKHYFDLSNSEKPVCLTLYAGGYFFGQPSFMTLFCFSHIWFASTGIRITLSSWIRSSDGGRSTIRHDDVARYFVHSAWYAWTVLLSVRSVISYFSRKCAHNADFCIYVRRFLYFPGLMFGPPHTFTHPHPLISNGLLDSLPTHPSNLTGGDSINNDLTTRR